MVVSEIKLYELLKLKLHLKDDEARDFVSHIENLSKEQVKEIFDHKKDTLSSKEDIFKLELKIEQNKVEIIKWMIGSAIAIIGLSVTIISFVISNLIK